MTSSQVRSFPKPAGFRRLFNVHSWAAVKLRKFRTFFGRLITSSSSFKLKDGELLFVNAVHALSNIGLNNKTRKMIPKYKMIRKCMAML